MSVQSEKDAREPVFLPAVLERNRIINPKQMAALLGFSVAHLRRLYRTGKIPRPKAIGGRKLGWPASIAMELTSPNQEAVADAQAGRPEALGRQTKHVWGCKPQRPHGSTYGVR